MIAFAAMLAVCILPALASALDCGGGDICVNTTGWWHGGGAFNASGTPIQHAINNATAGETICVYAGTYNETIDVTTDTLTIQSVSGDPSDTIIRADSKNETVVEITNCSGVNLSGFTVRGAAEISDAEVWGVYMNNASNCSFSNINITAIETTGNNNNGGLRLLDSDNNTFNTITITDIVGPFNVYGMVLGGHSNSFTDTTISNVKNGSIKAISMAGSNYTFVSTTISDIGGVDASIAYGIFIQGSASIASNHSFTGTDISDMTADSDAIGITQWAYCTGNNFAATTISNLKSNTSAYGLLFFGLNDGNTIDTTAISNVTALSGKAAGIKFHRYGNSDNEFNATIIENVTGQSAAYGIWLYKKDLNNDFVSTEIINVNATGGDSYGISISGGANNNSFVGGSITGTESGVNTNYDFYSDNTSHNNMVEDLLLCSYPTTVSFTYDNGVGLKGVENTPGDPTDKVNISKYVNATNVTADSWLFLNVSYNETDLGSVAEDSLSMWRHDGSDWAQVTGINGVNTAEKYVYANITEFSVFAPMGDAQGQPLNCTCGDICVNTTGWWRDGGAFNASGMPIQHAINNATAGDTINVAAGEYTENVNVNKQVTLAGAGADVVDVTATSSNDYVFEVTADYVNISGFNVTGATDFDKAGIYLNERQHCSISDTNALGNYHGILLSSSSNNTLTSNTANSNNETGIYLNSSSNNTIICNWVAFNEQRGFYLADGSTGNNITLNNIFANGNYDFRNDQSDDVNATENFWGTNNETKINASIYDWQDDPAKGNVTFLPKLTEPDPCAPIPDVAALVLFASGLMLAAVCFVWGGRRNGNRG